MDDVKIIELYNNRDESAIAETSEKYNSYLRKIANNILGSISDTEEVLNDTLNKVWESIPPTQPNSLRAFIGKITRNLAINKLEGRLAQKRGLGEVELILSELGESISSSKTVEDEVDNKQITIAINNFLNTLSKDKRCVFVRRYWYMESIKDISDFYNISESKVKSMLFRTRNKLKEYLESEGIMYD